MQKDSSRRRFELADRIIEVVDDRLTGEVLIDEALKMMKSSEKMSVGQWIDLMSGINTLPSPPPPVPQSSSVSGNLFLFWD
jgi:Golgi phosphoprotein 3 (GPP34)